MEKNQYRRLNLKNGWDLPKGEKVPLTGRRQELVRAYELLVQKTDEDYLKEAQLPTIQTGNHKLSNKKAENKNETDAQHLAWEADLECQARSLDFILKLVMD